MSLRREESLRSQKRDNLATLGKVKASHVESGEFSERAQREFDKWFFSLPRQEQDRLRSEGVEPYREQGDPRRRLCQIFENSNAFAYETPSAVRNETETFYSREKVLDILHAVLTSLACSADAQVRLHYELVKAALRMHDAKDGATIGKAYGVTRAGINYRVQKMRASLETALQTLHGAEPSPPGKESPRPPRPKRRVPHRGKKMQRICQKPRGFKPCRKG